MMLFHNCSAVCCSLKKSTTNLRQFIWFGWNEIQCLSSTLSACNVSGGIPNSDVGEGPLCLYNHRLSNGELRPDENQHVVVHHLHQLSVEVEQFMQRRSFHDNNVSLVTSKILNLFGLSSSSKVNKDEAKKFTNSPKGLYLYGGVGCGKTMLMDLFYDACSISHKKRIHFHAFMLDVHKRIHNVKMSMGEKNFNLNRSQPYDPILPVAREISDEASLLCFDEFQVTDIGDAMILKRLFSQMWQNGVVVISTSNRRPDDLYKNGLQRNNFIPFIPMLKMNCNIINLNSIDYRRQSAPIEGNTYFAIDRCNANFEMDRLYEELISRETANEGPKHLEVYGRTLTFQKTCGRILDATFTELCIKPLGAVDYLEICKHFDIVLLRDIPRMSLNQRSEARRFITLIDTLYDQKVRVVFSAECLPDELFSVSATSEYDRHQARVLIGDLNIKIGDSNEKASLFTGEEEVFAFERTVSRISDMRSASYWNLSDERPRT